MFLVMEKNAEEADFLDGGKEIVHRETFCGRLDLGVVHGVSPWLGIDCVYCKYTSFRSHCQYCQHKKIVTFGLHVSAGTTVAFMDYC